jgi:cytidylate kinase
MAVITISRQYGSGGDEIAARVCEMLGYRYFDKRLMVQVASEMGLSEDEVVDFTEEDYQVRGFLERIFARHTPRVVAQVGEWKRDTSGAWVPEIEQLDEDGCVRLVTGSIRAAHRMGNVVIVGRGGQAILQEMPGVLHVRVVAPLSDRVRLSQHRENLSVRDQAASAYLQRFHDIDWSDPTLYHLVINTARWSTEAAAHLIANAVSYLPPAASPD